MQGILVLVSGPQSKNAVGAHYNTKKPRTWFKNQKRLRRYKCLSIVALSNLLSVGRWFLYYETEVKSLSVQADKVWWLTGEAIMDVYGWAFGMNLTDLMDSLDYEGTRLPPASNPGITRSQLMWIPPSIQLPRLHSTELLWEPAEVSWESWGGAWAERTGLVCFKYKSSFQWKSFVLMSLHQHLVAIYPRPITLGTFSARLCKIEVCWQHFNTLNEI